MNRLLGKWIVCSADNSREKVSSLKNNLKIQNVFRFNCDCRFKSELESSEISIWNFVTWFHLNHLFIERIVLYVVRTCGLNHLLACYYATFTTLLANSADDKLVIFFLLFRKKTGLGISCKLSPKKKDIICMKCQNPFSGENKKNISRYRLLKVFTRMQSVKRITLQRIRKVLLSPVFCLSRIPAFRWFFFPADFEAYAWSSGLHCCSESWGPGF